MRNVDSISLMLQDAHKAEIHALPDGDFMLYVYLWQGEAPVSIGVSAYTWAKVKKNYPRFAEKAQEF